MFQDNLDTSLRNWELNEDCLVKAWINSSSFSSFPNINSWIGLIGWNKQMIYPSTSTPCFLLPQSLPEILLLPLLLLFQLVIDTELNDWITTHPLLRSRLVDENNFRYTGISTAAINFRAPPVHRVQLISPRFCQYSTRVLLTFANCATTNWRRRKRV